MQLLDLTLDSPAENVAMDEALLEMCEGFTDRGDVLRLWEPAKPLVVVGRSSVVVDEVELPYCRAHDLPVVRRCSGGAAIVTGPGCLMYALILQIARWPQLEMLDTAHQLVLHRMARALRSLGIDARMRGTSDLAVEDRKISGNSMRKTRDWVLYHGTMLYGLSSELIQSCLRDAPRQPAYRAGRDHADFVMNIDGQPDALRRAIAIAWNADKPLDDWPAARTKQLVSEKYGTDRWNLGR
jgi:lipoate-protein ligase A